MVWITPGGDVRVDAPTFEHLNIGFAKVAGVQCGRSRHTQVRRYRIQSRFDLSLIGRVVGEREANDQQALLLDRDLGVIVLLEPFGAAMFHDPRFTIGKVVLILVARPRRWRFGRAPARRPSGLTLFLGPLLHLCIILGLLQRRSFFRSRFQDGFGFGQARQAHLPDGDFVAHHQPIWQLSLI